MPTNESRTPEDDRRARLQSARRKTLLMIALLTLLAAAIIAAAAWLISGYEPPATPAEGRDLQVAGSAVSHSAEATAETARGYPQSR